MSHPADLLTIGCSEKEFIDNENWKSGPSWLIRGRTYRPKKHVEGENVVEEENKKNYDFVQVPNKHRAIVEESADCRLPILAVMARYQVAYIGSNIFVVPWVIVAPLVWHLVVPVPMARRYLTQ